MKQDRFLIALLAAVGILMITAVGLFFVRQDTRDYGTEDTPEGVVRNFVLAIHNEDFEKAVFYLRINVIFVDYLIAY